MRPLILLALLFSVTIAFNIFRDEAVPEEQLLSRSTRGADSSDSSDSDEKDVKEGSGSGESPAEQEEQLRRVVRDVIGEEESSGDEGSGSAEVTSVPIRFVRSADSVDSEGSGSGSGADE